MTLEAGSNVSSNIACHGWFGGGGGIASGGVRGKVILKANNIVTGTTSNNCFPIGSIPNCNGLARGRMDFDHRRMRAIVCRAW